MICQACEVAPAIKEVYYDTAGETAWVCEDCLLEYSEFHNEFVKSQQSVQVNSQHKAKDDIKLSEPPKGKSASADVLSIEEVKKYE